MRRHPCGGDAMKRIGRYIFNALTLLSLLLCAASIAMWIRSYKVLDYYGAPLGPIRFEFDSGAGWPQALLAADVVTNTYNDGWRSVRGTPTPRQWATGWRPGPNRFGFGFHLLRTVGPPQGNWRYGRRPILIVWAPYWCLTCVFAILPGLAVPLRIRRRRRLNREGRCRSCGYDLRATPDRCPECGTIPAKSKA
jgi:hypothetical protein